MSLRDQLLAKGLVSKKQAKRADQEARQERKQQEGALKRKHVREAEAHQQAEAERMAQVQDRQVRRAAYEAQRAQTERALQIRNTILGNRIRTGGNVPFHHLAPDGRTLPRMWVGRAVAEQLRRGDAAIVAESSRMDSPFVVVTRQAAVKLDAIAPQLVVFWARDAVGAAAPDQQILARDWEPSLRPHRARPEDLDSVAARAQMDHTS